MRGSGLARCRPITRPQNLCEAVGGSFPQPHFDQRSDYGSNHVFQKSVGVGLDEDLVVVADDRESLQMADGILVVRETSFEGGKVLCPDQRRGCLLHGRFIQRFVDVPDECAIDGGAGRSIKKTIGVELASRIVLGMKVIVHKGRGTNDNVFRQHGIERSHPVGFRPILVRAKTCHLPMRMHAGVCAACADDGYCGLAHLQDGPLDCFLDRRLVRLALPTGIAGPIVFQD